MAHGGLRSALVATGVVAVVCSAVAVAEPVPARSASVGCAGVQLVVHEKPLSPGVSTLTAAQVLTVGEALSAAAVSPNLVPTEPLINLANFIDNAYLAIEPWVAYAFELVSYAVGWIPYIGWIIDDQIWVVYNFVESLVNSGVFNITDWMRGEGTFAKNLADWVVDLGLALVWLAIDEVGAWIPLPPLNYPPRPPYADLPEGVFGDLIVDASAALARVSNGIWNVWEPIKGGIDNGVAWLTDVLDRFGRVPFVPLINFEVNATWDLIVTEGDALVGFAHDLINAGNQFVVDTVEGGGLIAATVNAINATLDSIRLRGGAAVQGFVDWGRAQVDYLVDLVTPGATVPEAVETAEIAVVESAQTRAIARQSSVVAPTEQVVEDAPRTAPRKASVPDAVKEEMEIAEDSEGFAAEDDSGVEENSAAEDEADDGVSGAEDEDAGDESGAESGGDDAETGAAAGGETESNGDQSPTATESE